MTERRGYSGGELAVVVLVIVLLTLFMAYSPFFPNGSYYPVLEACVW